MVTLILLVSAWTGWLDGDDFLSRLALDTGDGGLYWRLSNGRNCRG